MGGPGSWLGGLLGDRYGRAMSALLMVSVSGLCTLVLGAVENHWPFATLPKTAWKRRCCCCC